MSETEEGSMDWANPKDDMQSAEHAMTELAAIAIRLYSCMIEEASYRD